MYNDISDLTEAMVEKFQTTDAVAAHGGCVLWMGRLDRYGYGSVECRHNGRRMGTGAHRIAYMLHRGRIPKGLVIDHLCRVRNCINPWHLEAVTNGENIRRGDTGLGDPEACANGHLWSGGDYYLKQGRYKVCRHCSRAAQKRWRANRKAATAA